MLSTKPPSATRGSAGAREALSLHVLPPAFGLPTSDADCLAAILYLQYALPADRWVVIGDGWRDFEKGQGMRGASFFFLPSGSFVSILEKRPQLCETYSCPQTLRPTHRAPYAP